MDLQLLFIFMTFPISFPMMLLINKTPIGRLGKRLPYHPRLLNYMWAAWGCYFWASCPICHKSFGGHEGGNGSLMHDWNSGQVVCRKCAYLAEQVNMQNMPKMKPISLYVVQANPSDKNH